MSGDASTGTYIGRVGGAGEQKARLQVVGPSRTRLFGLDPATRLERQLGGLLVSKHIDGTLVVRGDVAAADSTIEWLFHNPGRILGNAAGEPLIGFVDHARGAALARAMEGGAGADFELLAPAQWPNVFSRKLRRRQPLIALDLRRTPPREAERTLFEHVYKGITDLVTRHVWPAPALVVTRWLAARRVSPNLVSAAAIVLTLLASYWFAEAAWLPGFAAAWAMSFLDTVDGKLARVTATSTQIGNILDHGNDLLHPPLWWICFAVGIHAASPDPMIWTWCAVILATYVLSRGVELGFKARLGFNQFMWRPIDGQVRAVIARRNINLLILTVGIALGLGAESYALVGIWSIASLVYQLVRWAQAEIARRRAGVTVWLA